MEDSVANTSEQQQPEKQLNSQIKAIWDYFSHNPGMMLSVGYVLLTLCGIFYSMAFFGQFGIDILKLADVADLLIVGISEPAAMLMFSGGLIVAWGYELLFKYSYRIQQRWLAKPKSKKRTIVLAMNYVPKSSAAIIIGLALMFILYANVFVSLYAEWRSDKTKSAGGATVILESGVSSTPQPVKLLGSTSNYVFTYNVESSEATIIPVENIIKITPVVEPSVDE
ncbi:MAG: hypothetical protein ACFHVJ_08850 [Aestuariibacter sp.]